MKELSFKQMEAIIGGNFNCGLAIVMYAAAWGALTVATGGVAAAGFAVVGLYGGALGLTACAYKR